MPKNIAPQDQWETEFEVPLPGEPRNIGPLETLFQRLLNRTERLKNRIGAILGAPWDSNPPSTIVQLHDRTSALEAQLDAVRNAPTITPSPGDWLLGRQASGIGVGKLPIGPGVNGIPFHSGDGRGVELKGVHSVAHLAGEFTTAPGQGRWVRLLRIVLDGNYRGARGEIWFGRAHDGKSFSSRLGYYVGTNEARLALAPGLPSVGESGTGVITDAAIVQVEANTYELWVQVYTDAYPLNIAWHHHGAAYDPKISYAPLQSTSLPAPVSGGLAIQWSTLSSSSPSLGWFGRIVQSGSNANGHYIRYDDGTQIVFHTYPGGADFFTWVYPAAFIEAPVVQATTRKSGIDTPIVVTLDTEPSATSVALKRWYWRDYNNTFSGAIEPTHLVAIGRWK